MAKPDWPPMEERTWLGKRVDRRDGPVKAAGTAKYAYDINRPRMLWAKIVTSAHAHAEVTDIDTGPASGMNGVVAVWKDEEVKEALYAGQILAAVAAETEEIAEEAAQRVKVTYKPLPHQLNDNDPALAEGRPSNREEGDTDKALGEADVVVSGDYGCPIITHCCLEPHGQVADMREDSLYIWPSTQNASRYSDRLGEELGVPQNKIHVDVQYMGGGFGSKFAYDKWGVIGAQLSIQTGRPVKLMLDRHQELALGGNRPSAFARVKVGATRDGQLTGMDAEIWGTAGLSGRVPDNIPYVFNIPNFRRTAKRITTNQGGARAWRAPNHPQSCLITMAAIEDAAAALKMDALEFFQKNLDLTDRPEVYREELKIAADLIGYAQKAHPRGDVTPGPVKRGLGISLHTWGGRGHPSECDVTLHPDGSVDARIGTQDLGTATRTCIAIVVAETLGLSPGNINVEIGSNDYPVSGASGGSTTIGGISVSSRMAATEALNALLEVAAPRLGAAADTIKARGGNLEGPGGRRLAWKEACALLGPNPITKRGVHDPRVSVDAGMISSGVGGVQMADVSVDVETGIVTINEMVAVQDCGLIVNLKTAESQVLGALIMGITYALFEEAVYDHTTGRLLNADMEFYRLAGLSDVGQLKVHMMQSKPYDSRGVIGLGEPPVISPGAAIANAVANAIGRRVPHIPLTPDRVLATLQKGGQA